MTSPARPFARYGTEKMVYDVRMSPQALWHEDTIFIVYHSTGGEDAELRGHPYAITYEVSSRPLVGTGQAGHGPWLRPSLRADHLARSGQPSARALPLSRR